MCSRVLEKTVKNREGVKARLKLHVVSMAQSLYMYRVGFLKKIAHGPRLSSR